MKRFIFALTAVAFAGCTVYEPIQIVPDHIQTVKIDIFENRTQQIGLSTDLTQEVINEFIKEGRLSILNSEDADSVLNGSIVEYSKIPISYDENFVAQEYKITMIVNLSYYDQVQGVKLWDELREGLSGGIETWVKYYVGEDAEFVETEEEARQRLIFDISKKILDRTVYGWE